MAGPWPMTSPSAALIRTCFRTYSSIQVQKNRCTTAYACFRSKQKLWHIFCRHTLTKYKQFTNEMWYVIQISCDPIPTLRRFLRYRPRESVSGFAVGRACLQVAGEGGWNAAGTHGSASSLCQSCRRDGTWHSHKVRTKKKTSCQLVTKKSTVISILISCPICSFCQRKQ